ncbi:MAG: ADP-glyceromanno-heptose 6-epimerase [Gammaproteobacteria bacterium]|nr:ADP-glyceromanno-heptose 6-epimerase [Gammaproteobacteria bacterium]
MIIVTGGAGFIGSHLVKGLNQLGCDEIVIVDHLKSSEKITNLSGVRFYDYLDKFSFLEAVKTRREFSKPIQAIFHQGACSDTTCTDLHYLLENNFEYSKQLLHYAMHTAIPFIYASSASVYGLASTFKEHPDYEHPLNGYAFSKFVFDQYVRKILPEAHIPIIGLRYFNVYGLHECHKGPMASVIFHFNQQAKKEGCIRLFEGSGGYKNGEQRRDFVAVEDIVRVNLWFLEHLKHSGIFNVGTGKSASFNQVAHAILQRYPGGVLRYIPFPESLKEHYQHFTEADVTALRAVGYNEPFRSIEKGIPLYLKQQV